jgi:hypothetical protein
MLAIEAKIEFMPGRAQNSKPFGDNFRTDTIAFENGNLKRAHWSRL